MLRSKTIQLSDTDGVKSLADILGVSEIFTTVIVRCASAQGVSVGDASINSTNTGLIFGVLGSLSILSLFEKTFNFDCKDNPAENLYFLSRGTNQELTVLAY